MVQIQWLRRFVRRRMSPLPEDTARKWKQRLSLLYVLIGWNTFGYVAYTWSQGKLDWAHHYGLKTDEEKMIPNNEYFARELGRGTMKLVTIKGFSSVSVRDYKDEESQNDEKATQNDESNEELDLQEKLVRALEEIRKEKKSTD